MKNYASYIVLNNFRDEKFKQFIYLYSSSIASLAFSIIISVINTRLLGPIVFGEFKYLQNLFNLIVIFTTVGVFVSGGRLLAKKENIEIKGLIYGNLFIISIFVSFIYCLAIYIIVRYAGGNITKNMQDVVVWCMPLLIVFPLSLFVENVFQGDNKIRHLSAFRIFPKFIYLAVTAPILVFVGSSDLQTIMPLHLLSILVVFILLIKKLDVVYKLETSILKALFRENRSYGFHVYVGSISNVGTAMLAGITIGLFVDNKSVGLFSLALGITYPLTMLPSVIGTVLFKDFANRDCLPTSITIGTIALSFLSLAVFFLIVERVFLLLYTEEFLAAVKLTYGIGFASILRGLGDYYNKFLGSKGQGRQLRNGAFINGASNLFGNTLLVYLFGLFGAVLTKLMSDFLYFFSMLYYYKKYVMEEKNAV